MKKYIFIIVVMLSVTITSCEQLGSVTDIEPEYVLTDENAFTNVSSTEAILNGLYQQWRNNGITQMRNAMFQLTRTTVNTNVARAYEFKINDVNVSSPLVKGYYEDMYRLINQASSIIDLLPNETPKDLSVERKQEIIGEAYFNRGLAIFMLLRSFGEFWDINSQYGVVVYDSPARENEAKARASVKACYEQINNDLEQAIKLCPSYTKSYYANKIAALAIKAKVALYLNDFSEVLQLCSKLETEVQDCGLVLETNYADIFTKGYDSSELLYSIYTAYPQETIGTGIFNDFFFNGVDGTSTVRIADELIGSSEDGDMYSGDGMDPRYKDVYLWNEGSLFMAKYPQNFNEKDANPYYIVRLAEIYLMKAEAECRLGNLDNSRASLKMITDRAGYPGNYVSEIDDSDLLLKILQHKFVELNAENYEEWFDMVRYNVLDNIDFVKLKYIRSDKHRCLPVPYDAIAGNNLLVQNADYIYDK